MHDDTVERASYAGMKSSFGHSVLPFWYQPKLLPLQYERTAPLHRKPHQQVLPRRCCGSSWRGSRSRCPEADVVARVGLAVEELEAVPGAAAVTDRRIGVGDVIGAREVRLFELAVALELRLLLRDRDAGLRDGLGAVGVAVDDGARDERARIGGGWRSMSAVAHAVANIATRRIARRVFMRPSFPAVAHVHAAGRMHDAAYARWRALKRGRDESVSSHGDV